MPEEFFKDISNQQTPPTYNFFDGVSWKQSSSGKTAEVKSPIDGSILGQVQSVSPEEIYATLVQSKNAQKAWEATPLYSRVKVMHLAADWIRHFEEYLTTLLVNEIGKTPEESRNEITRTADLTDYFADVVQSLRGEEMESDQFPGYDKGKIAQIERVAHGVVVAVAPFNYPVNLAASKIVPALLMGNSVVFKPATQGGISGIHLTQIFKKSGVPDGVISCVTGKGSEVGDALMSHKNVSMVAFTGSSETGMAIVKNLPMKPILFECGGNNAALILPDADLHLAAREIVKGGFSYAGQRCTAIKYVLGTSGVLESLLQEVLLQMKELVHMGDPRNPETKLVGPLISEDVAIHIKQMIDDSVAMGAKIATGGARNGAFLEPTILTEVKPDMPVVKKEIFGPVLSFVSVNTVNDAITIINGSEFGLQASVFTKDESAGMIVAKQLNVGTVQINGSPQRGPDHFPFLGIKQSGVGVQGVRYSLEAMSRLRPIVINKPQ